MHKINEYLPKSLQEIKEFQIINEDLDIELDNIDTLVKKVQTETIVQTATEYGIKRWENALGIKPTDNESLEVRRFRINTILGSKLPYTLRWLQNKLTQIVGSESGWTLNISYADYTITVILSGLDTELMLEVEKQLRNAIPANMEMVIGGPSITSSTIRFGIGMMFATKYEIKSSYEMVKFDFNVGTFFDGSIGEDGLLDDSEAGVAISSDYVCLLKDREYVFGNDQDYKIYGLAFYDIYGKLITRYTGLNTNEFRTPADYQIVRVTIMNENGIRTDDISGAYFMQK